jgi:hypothetical protein
MSGWWVTVEKLDRATWWSELAATEYAKELNQNPECFGGGWVAETLAT